eukprot:GHRR01019996.1.p1 GENE.GHRR01019996.1~~GHRR01019996.1.p1  ORF type:complete len:848 (+),score=279.58 GHRR01019996.1:379-2922(+)
MSCKEAFYWLCFNTRLEDENLGLPPPKSAIRSSAVSRKGSIAEPSRQSPAVTSGAVNSNAAGNATVLNGNTVTPQQGQPTAANAEVGGNLAADSSTIAPQPASVAPSTTAKAAADAPAPAPAAAPKASAAPGSTQVALESKAWTTSAPPGAAPVPVVASPVLKPAATAAPTAASNGPAAAAPTASEPVALTGSAAILAKLRSQRAAGGGSSTAGSTTAATPAAKLTVLYASQTGTAQEIARTIHAESASRGMLSEVMSMNELGFDNLSAAKTPVVVVIASSTGDGDPPDNAAATYVALKKSWPSDRLAGIHFTVLGLGDSNYTRFMHVPRAIKNRFLDLGATCFYPCIEADEVDGLEDKVDPWCESLYAPVQKALQGEKPQQQHQQAAADGVPAGTAVAGKANAPAANNIQHHQQGALAAGPSQAANGSLSSEQSNALFAAVMHEEASDEAGDKPQVHMELSGTSSVLSRPDSLLGEDSAKVTSKAPAKSASTLDSPAVVATAGRLVNGLAPHGVDLKGVPPLAPCRIMLKQQVPQSVLGVAKQREWQLPSNEQKAYRDPSGIYSAEAPFWARVSDARLMTADWSDRIVIHLELDITGSNMQYASGDAVGVLPQNSVLMVSGLLTRLGLDGDTVFEIQPASGDTSGHGLLHHIPWPCTLRHAFTNCTDLTSVPRKSLLRLLAEHCKDQDEQRTLLYFTSRAGREAYAEEITRGQPSLLDLLRRFPSCQPPIGALLDTLPPLAPRMYSLSCAPVNGKVPGACGPNRVQFALSVVEFATKYGTRHGVATTWLANLCRPWLSAEVRKGEQRLGCRTTAFQQRQYLCLHCWQMPGCLHAAIGYQYWHVSSP